MSSNSHSEKEFVQEQYEQMLRAHQQDETVLVSHYGELSQSVISNLEGNVEEKITTLDIAKGPIKKIFFISVETLQNMLLHGHKNSAGEQHNFFILVKNGSNLKVISSNLVANSSIPALENNTMSDKGGAGLGFITIGMKSGNKLKVDFKKINDNFSLFTLTSSVNLS